MYLHSNAPRALESSFKDKFNMNAELIDLASDFVQAARTFVGTANCCNFSRYGRIIIKERYIPVEHKTIKPTSIGGIVGGEKYIVHKILFKVRKFSLFLLIGTVCCGSTCKISCLSGVINIGNVYK